MEEIVLRKWTVPSHCLPIRLTGGGPHETRPRGFCAYVPRPASLTACRLVLSLARPPA
jgi:hypothetical protein